MKHDLVCSVCHRTIAYFDGNDSDITFVFCVDCDFRHKLKHWILDNMVIEA